MWEVLVIIALLTGIAYALRAWMTVPLHIVPPSPAAAAPDDPRTYKPETWCFVGENTLGRYCVQRDEGTCGPLDTFPSREACEYTESSALPLGVTANGGLVYNPFMSPNQSLYHTF